MHRLRLPGEPVEVSTLDRPRILEYEARGWRGRLGYWLFRHPLVMFGIGPIWSLVVGPRFLPKGGGRKLRRSVVWTNLALAVMVGGTLFALWWVGKLLGLF